MKRINTGVHDVVFLPYLQKVSDHAYALLLYSDDQPGAGRA